ncbi:MAG: prepilin-type N-terminal cleavage/methylation domain-containing protein [Deltaproteobacteria bacterium]|nr:prepilin-type N-terminal cleavage/methylation domain-containing protein [Deltaproteobacteria bacterium]MBN2687355.1 prepilin-type N-terminal cleavage/methylation domain-containing protein [Deltaproteobacteria bacterium]
MAKKRTCMTVDKEKGRRNKGFTLIEVMIALFILSVGLLAVATMQISAIRGNRMGNDITQATFLAEDTLEQLKNSSNIAAVANGNDVVGIYNRNWTLTAASGVARTVTVTVSWSIMGTNHAVTLTTITRGDGA